jgi:cystathionine beta-lyase/cystathionine gamma-synthase
LGGVESLVDHPYTLSLSFSFSVSIWAFLMSLISLWICSSTVPFSAIMTHASVPLEERVKLGISDSLVRLSVGLEDVNDLIQDLSNALDQVQIWKEKNPFFLNEINSSFAF